MHKILYLGIDPSRYRYQGELTHCPIIRTVPLPLDPNVFSVWSSITHVLFTSPSSVQHWPLALDGKQLLSVGHGTASQLKSSSLIAPFATQEGVIELIKTLDIGYLLWPRSSQARPVLEEYLIQSQIRFLVVDLYETQIQVQRVDLNAFDELVFTSPSTVHAFVELYGSIPFEKKITPIGPITARALEIIRESGIVPNKK